MPSRTFNLIRSKASGIVQIFGSFAPNGASNPVTQTGVGFQSVTHGGGTNSYTITFGRTPTAGPVEVDLYFGLASASVQIQQNAASINQAILGPISIGAGITPQTVQILTVATSTGAAVNDLAAATNNVIWFTFNLILTTQLNNN